MSKFWKRPCPDDLSKRIIEAMCIGPIEKTPERMANTIRDYASQKLTTLSLKNEMKPMTASEVIDQMCDAFGLNKPSEQE